MKIAKMFDVDLKEIIILNRDIINQDLIYPGQIILISK
ncbi:LysM peptidoglycan-binding domain-containing protein [Vibrio parahaemolyticus]|nr:LysM peptidoglycan-binding domain-containing protein [Vibrio parahaemolyticus]